MQSPKYIPVHTVSSVIQLIQMILTRLKEPKELKDDCKETMLKMYEDSSITAEAEPRQALN